MDINKPVKKIITIEILPELYEEVKKKLSDKTLRDALKDPFVMIALHVVEGGDDE